MTVTSSSVSNLQAQEADQPSSQYWIDVRSLGAKGDGSTDDTKIFQDALDDLSERGGVLFVPGGSYKITSTLTITGKSPVNPDKLDWIEIRGVGESSRLVGKGVKSILAAKDLRDEKGQRVYANGVRISHLTFTADAEKGEEKCNGIDATFFLRWSCQNSNFLKLKSGIHSVALDPQDQARISAWIIRIQDSFFTGCEDYAINMARVFDLVIDSNIIEHGRGGISVGTPGDGFTAAGHTVRIENNVIEGLSGTEKPAILASCLIGARIEGNYFEANSGGDIVITPKNDDGWSRAISINTNTFSPTKEQRENPDYGPILLQKAQDVIVTANFSTGSRLFHSESGPFGKGVNIASNILNNPPETATMEGAKDGGPIDQIGKLRSTKDVERWTVSSPVGAAEINSVFGFRYQPKGGQVQSIRYGSESPTGGQITYQSGDIIFTEKPSMQEGKILLGWICIEAGAPGQWKKFYATSE